MGAKRYTILLFALALAPSAYLAWSWRDMPHLGLHHDDTLYLVGAKSLAEGHGYRIQSLPGQPFQTKYPPVFSALIAPLWKYGPAFPRNLPLLTLFAWLMVPAYLFFMRAVFRHFGCRPRETWLLTFVAAAHPMVLLLGMSVMSDLLFMALFLACLLLAERALEPTQSAWLALAAGGLSGLAYLTRTSAFPIVFTAPLCFLLLRRYWRAVLFLASMLPAVVGWQFWTSAHMLRTSDPALLYYTNYMGMELATVHLDNLAGVLWRNFDGLLRGIAKLIVFDVLPTNTHFQQVIGVAAIAGIVRLVKRTGRLQYPAVAVCLALLLCGYFFPPDERILLPVYPLLLMGFWTEAKNLWAVVRLAWRRGRPAERMLAAVAGTAVAALGGLVVASYVEGHFGYLPRLRAASQSEQLRFQPAYDWIRSHTAPTATVYAYLDPLLYLYTGRHALGLPILPAKLYQDNASDHAREYPLSILRQAKERDVDYLLITTADGYMEGLKGRLWEAAARDPTLRQEFTAAHAAVYRYVR